MATAISTSSRITSVQKKFLKFFKKGFQDQKYYDWERGYKEEAHHAWVELLNKKTYQKLLDEKNFEEICRRVIGIESKTNLLFSFEKMALRDAVKMPGDAKMFAEGLFKYIYGSGPMERKFEDYISMLSRLRRVQTRVLTWPVATVFGFIADPEKHIFLKPRVTQTAAEVYGYDFLYVSKVNWETYHDLLEWTEIIKNDLQGWKPKDLIDIQSFIWVLGSDEYN